MLLFLPVRENYWLGYAALILRTQGSGSQAFLRLQQKQYKALCTASSLTAPVTHTQGLQELDQHLPREADHHFVVSGRWLGFQGQLNLFSGSCDYQALVQCQKKSQC